MPLSNMRSDTAFPTAPVGQEPGVHQGAGVTAPAMAQPFRVHLTQPQPNYGSCDEDEPGPRRTEPLETGAQTNSEETDPWPTHRNCSHSRVARDPGSGGLGAGRSPAGSPELAGAFLGAEPGTCSSVWGRSPAAPAAVECAGRCHRQRGGQPARRSAFQGEQNSS